MGEKNSGLAAVASFLIIGAGQIYNGQVGKGIAFFLLAGIFLVLSFLLIGIPFLLGLWVYAIYDAYSTAEAINAGIRQGQGTVPQVPAAPVRVCLGCGVQLQAGTRFCSNCGRDAMASAQPPS